MVNLTYGIAMPVRCRSPGIINVSIVQVIEHAYFLFNLIFFYKDDIRKHQNQTGFYILLPQYHAAPGSRIRSGVLLFTGAISAKISDGTNGPAAGQTCKSYQPRP